MVIARVWADRTGNGKGETGSVRHPSKTSSGFVISPFRPTVRLSDSPSSIVRMRENGLYEIVEHPGFSRHRPARVGVHVPGAQLVQRRGFLVREVQDIAVAARLARGAVQDLPEDIGQVPRPADGVVLRAADREIHVVPCQWRVAGEIFSPRPFLARNRCHAPSSSPPGSTFPSASSPMTISRESWTPPTSGSPSARGSRPDTGCRMAKPALAWHGGRPCRRS